MADKTMVPLKTLATDQATPDQLRYWLKLLGIAPEVSKRIAYLTPAQADQVRQMAAAVATGTPPREAAAGIAPESTTALAVPQAPDLTPRLEGIEKALFVVVEELKASRQESAAIRAEIIALRQENQALRLRLEPPAVSFASTPQPVIPWSPTPRIDPREYKPWYQVLWWELTAPEKLRRADA